MYSIALKAHHDSKKENAIQPFENDFGEIKFTKIIEGIKGKPSFLYALRSLYLLGIEGHSYLVHRRIQHKIVLRPFVAPIPVGYHRAYIIGDKRMGIVNASYSVTPSFNEYKIC